mgnify:FL=1
MKIRSDSFAHLAPIPSRYAFGAPSATAPMAYGENENPHLEWSEVPAGTASFLLICVDDDVPTVFDDVNKEGRSIAADLPRQDFIHWVMADIPGALRNIAAGSCARGIHAGGKRQPPGPAGTRQGVNDYTMFMGDGDYLGYDGPCPPWNDERLHHYHFRLYALDLTQLELPARFTAKDALAAAHGHILAQATLTGTYTLNRQLLG